MKIDLSNKRAVVTGSTAGIGFAIASGLAQAGASVVINGRTSQKVDAAKKALLEKVPGAKVEGVAADLATAQGVADFIKRVPDADILVNNPASSSRKRSKTLPTPTGRDFSKPM